MARKHAAKGPKKWKIFATCVQEVISKISKIPIVPNNILQEKLDYISFINGNIDTFKFGDMEMSSKHDVPVKTKVQPFSGE